MKFLFKTLKWLGIIAAVLVFSLFILTSFIINRYKTDVERAITSQFGIEAQIEGKMQLKILPGFSLVINKLNLVNHETYFLRAENVEFSMDFQSFVFGSNTIITSIHLNKPQVFIFKNEKDIFNFEPISQGVNNLESKILYKLNNISIEDGKLLYFDAQHDDTLFISGIKMSTHQIRIDGNFEKFSLKNTYFEGDLNFCNLRLNALRLKNLQFKIVEINEQIVLSPANQKFYGGTLNGNVSIDLTKQIPETTLSFSANKVKIDSLLMDFETALYLRGNVELQADIQFNNFDWNTVKKSLRGNLSIAGENVTVYGFQTNVALEKFSKSGQFSAVNAGAALMAGPLGAIFTNDNALAKLLTYDSGDSTVANYLISKWSFENGIAKAEDVAFSESKYRIAVTGSVNCLERRYQNLNISLLNATGCPVLSQQLNGDFQGVNPETISFIENKNGVKVSVDEAISMRKDCLTPYSGTIALF
jgi:uncharacterized protein involved in outer membrane biogenesis